MKHFALMIFISVASCADPHAEKKIEAQTIVDVGGCNKDGWCGIKTSTGEYGRAHFPVVGAKVCSKRFDDFFYCTKE